MLIKKSLVVIFILLILINLVSSAQDVVVQQDKPVKQSWFQKYVGWWLFSPIFLGAVFFLFLFFLILIGIIFLVKWLIKYIKSQNDVYYALKRDKIKLAKIQRSYRSKHWYKVQKNTPIKLVRIVNGKPHISNAIAYHRGDFTSAEGNVSIAMNLSGDNKYFFFPITSLLVIPNMEQIKIPAKDQKGNKEDIIIKNLPRANDIIQFNENEILIYAESISNIGLFYIPVLKAKDGKIVDLTMPVYQSLREVVVSEYLFTQTGEFVNVARKSIDMNPHIRAETKINDSSGSVEIPKTSTGQV